MRNNFFDQLFWELQLLNSSINSLAKREKTCFLKKKRWDSWSRATSFTHVSPKTSCYTPNTCKNFIVSIVKMSAWLRFPSLDLFTHIRGRRNLGHWLSQKLNYLLYCNWSDEPKEPFDDFGTLMSANLLAPFCLSIDLEPDFEVQKEGT